MASSSLSPRKKTKTQPDHFKLQPWSVSLKLSIWSFSDAAQHPRVPALKSPIGPQLAHLLQLACWNPTVPALKSFMGPTAGSLSAASILGSKGPGLRVSYRARSWFTHPAFKSSIAPTAGSLAEASISGSKGPSLQVFNRSTAGSLTAASILGSKGPSLQVFYGAHNWFTYCS